MRFSINIIESCAALYSNSSVAASTKTDLIGERSVTKPSSQSDASALSDYPGMLADARIRDLARLVIATIRRLENLTVKCVPKCSDIHNRNEIKADCTPLPQIVNLRHATRSPTAQLPSKF